LTKVVTKRRGREDEVVVKRDCRKRTVAKKRNVRMQELAWCISGYILQPDMGETHR